MRSNGIGVRTEEPGPHLFGVADRRRWIKDETRGAMKAMLDAAIRSDHEAPYTTTGLFPIGGNALRTILGLVP